MKILCIGHDANRAGAQILFLQFLTWLKLNSKDVHFEVLLSNGGDLLPDYSEIGDVKVIGIDKRKSTFINRIISVINKNILLKKLRKKRFDIIYANTILNGELLNLLKNLNIPVITHVHELNYWISRGGERNLNLVKSATNKFIAVSKSVENFLIENCKIEKNKVVKINEFVDFNLVVKEKKSLRKKLNLPIDSYIIGASGAEVWRKGKDWFIPLAIDVLSRQLNKNVHFVWIGGELNFELQKDLVTSGHEDKIHFISHLPNANSYFHEFSVFVMLSREDPFPVVNLEAAAQGVPIVCFDNSGGSPELMEEGYGFIVPYGYIHEFANRVTSLIVDDDLRSSYKKNSAQKIKSKYHIDVIAKKLLEEIEKLLNERNKIIS